MKLDLKSLDPEKSQDFLNFFIAKLKESIGNEFFVTGSAGYNEKVRKPATLTTFSRFNYNQDKYFDNKYLISI